VRGSGLYLENATSWNLIQLRAPIRQLCFSFILYQIKHQKRSTITSHTMIHISQIRGTYGGISNGSTMSMDLEDSPLYQLTPQGNPALSKTLALESLQLPHTITDTHSTAIPETVTSLEAWNRVESSGLQSSLVPTKAIRTRQALTEALGTGRLLKCGLDYWTESRIREVEDAVLQTAAVLDSPIVNSQCGMLCSAILGPMLISRWNGVRSRRRRTTLNACPSTRASPDRYDLRSSVISQLGSQITVDCTTSLPLSALRSGHRRSVYLLHDTAHRRE
jgi:hypothetical protein